GTANVHIAVAALSPDETRLETALGRAGDALRGMPGVETIWRQEVYALPNQRTSFGYKDGVSHPSVDGSGISGTNPHEAPLKAGEFVLGYADETGYLPPMPYPEVLGRNGTYVVVRKLH